MKKKVILLLSLFILGLVLVACDDDKDTTTTAEPTETTEQKDNNPPAFYGVVEGKLQALEQLEGDNIDPLQGIQVVDDVTDTDDIKLEVIDWGNYDKDQPGEYTITIRATDEAGNYTDVQRDIIVLPALVKTFDALVHGEAYVEIEINSDWALKSESEYGMNARISDKVFVMGKDFFLEQLDVVQGQYSENGGTPYLPYGAMAILTSDLKVKLFRTDIGNLFEINENNELKYDSALTWTRDKSADKPGGVLAGVKELINTLIPDDGYVVFTSSYGDQRGRTFLTNQLFSSTYGGGAGTKEMWDRDVREVQFQIIKDFEVKVPVPDKLPAPEIKLERGILSWNAIDNAKEYQILVDGEVKLTVTETTLSILDLNLEVTPEGGDPYTITVVAVTRDIYRWSTSDPSNEIKYTQNEVSKLEAPEISLEGTVISWNAVDNASEYMVIVRAANVVLKEIITTELSYDVAPLGDEFPGGVNVTVLSRGDGITYLDSIESEPITVFIGEVKSFVAGGYTVDLLETSAYNYFLRRNTNYADQNGNLLTGFSGAPYLFLITDIDDILDPEFGLDQSAVNEAYSVVILLDKNGNVKAINNIFTNTWTSEKGWHNDDFYTNNAKQIDNLKKYIAEGDMLLIGKNGCNVEAVEEDGSTVSVGARELLAYLFINDWDYFPQAAQGSDGWRAGIENFTINPAEVQFEITEKVQGDEVK